jgi:hypothetical protein
MRAEKPADRVGRRVAGTRAVDDRDVEANSAEG